MNRREINLRVGMIITAAMRVHTELGPGLLESAYEACLTYELRVRGLGVRSQVALPVTYRGIRVPDGYRLDIVVDDAIVVETKTVAGLLPIHEAQLLSYLKLGNYRVGLLINFHAPRLKLGIRRLVHGNLDSP